MTDGAYARSWRATVENQEEPMTRRFNAFAIVLVVFALFVSACGGDSEDETTTTQAAW